MVSTVATHGLHKLASQMVYSMFAGNWATDLSGGAQFGYTLLFVILLSSIFSMFLQHLALKLGAVTERDLAQACR